jgi:hypothetical protein
VVQLLLEFSFVLVRDLWAVVDEALVQADQPLANRLLSDLLGEALVVHTVEEFRVLHLDNLLGILVLR